MPVALRVDEAADVLVLVLIQNLFTLANDLLDKRVGVAEILARIISILVILQGHISAQPVANSVQLFAQVLLLQLYEMVEGFDVNAPLCLF